MKSSIVFLHLAVLFSGLTVLAAEDSYDYDPHLAHFGDIKLANIHRPDSNSVRGELKVFYRRDDQKPGWRDVCSEHFVSEGAKAICNMLGYEDGFSLGIIFELETERLSHDYALTNLSCSEPMSNGAPPNHLLRCSKALYIGDPGNCLQGPVNLQCSNPKGYPLMDKGYEGQVQLCPPDNFSSEANPAAQVSMGIVSVFENTQWGSLNENNSSQRVTHQQANSICRHLGFTGAVADSARTVQTYTGHYTFSKCQHVNKVSSEGLQGVWLRLSQARQCEQACSCFSCCYTHPHSDAKCPKGAMVNNQCTNGHCCQQNDVVIECTFDPTIDPPPESGSKTTCSFQNGHSPCAQQTSDNTFPREQVLIGVLVPVACIVLLVTMVVVIVIGRRVYTRHRRDGYEPIPPGNNGGHPNRGGNGHGNQGQGNGNGNGGNGNGHN